MLEVELLPSLSGRFTLGIRASELIVLDAGWFPQPMVRGKIYELQIVEPVTTYKTILRSVIFQVLMVTSIECDYLLGCCAV